MAVAPNGGWETSRGLSIYKEEGGLLKITGTITTTYTICYHHNLLPPQLIQSGCSNKLCEGPLFSPGHLPLLACCWHLHVSYSQDCNRLVLGFWTRQFIGAWSWLDVTLVQYLRGASKFTWYFQIIDTSSVNCTETNFTNVKVKCS